MKQFSDEQFSAIVQNAVQSERVVPADSLRARILDDRAQGERVIIPVHTGRIALGVRWRWAAVAAAVAFAALLPMMWPKRARVENVANESFESGGLVSLAYAQNVPLPNAPNLPAMKELNGDRLHATNLDFEQRWTDTLGAQTMSARSSFSLAPVTEGGIPAWRATTVWRGNIGSPTEQLDAETLYVARADLRPLRRQARVVPYKSYANITISQMFRGDSVVGGMAAQRKDGGSVRRPIAQKLPIAFAPFITEAIAPAFLGSAQLSVGWKRSLSLVGWAVRPNDVFASADFRVTGDDRVTVPAGTFDCWRLELIVGTHRVTHWSRKSDGVGVKTRDETERTTKGVREITLIRE